jgi:hypothetical protein
LLHEPNRLLAKKTLSILPLWSGFRFDKSIAFCARENAFARLMNKTGLAHRQMQGAHSS